MYFWPLLLITLLYGVYYYFTRTFDYWKKKKVIGPQPMPFFGNYYEFIMRQKVQGQIMKEIYDQYQNEKVVGFYRLVKPAVLIRDLDIIKQILIKDFDSFADRGIEFSKEGLGGNLFHADGDTWRMLRNRFTPLFTSGKLKNMSYLMTNRADAFLKHVQNRVSKDPVQEVQKLVQKYTVSTIAACAFGVDMDIDKDEQIMKQLSTFDKLVFEVSFFFDLDIMYPGILNSLNTSMFPKSIQNFFYNLTKKVISERNGAAIGRKDFMDLILELRQQGGVKGTRRSDEKEMQLEFTDDVIAAQAFIFYVAGYETSATTMTFMLYELARNKHIQDKVLAEIDEALQKHDGKITYDAINDLKYMEKVFDETLRMYPVVDNLQRRAVVDYKVPGLDLEIKKGQLIFVSVVGIHHDAQHYPDPEKFDPERFAADHQDRHPSAYLPFGIGPRNCIGMRFAKVQTRVCLMTLLSKYRVEMTDKTPRQMEYDPRRIITSPRGGLYLKLVARS